MEDNYVIAWTSKLRGSRGLGKNIFTLDEAKKLAEELNQDYPDFFHEALNLRSGESYSEESDNMTGANVIVLNADASSSSSTVSLPTPDAEVA